MMNMFRITGERNFSKNYDRQIHISLAHEKTWFWYRFQEEKSKRLSDTVFFVSPANMDLAMKIFTGISFPRDSKQIDHSSYCQLTTLRRYPGEYVKTIGVCRFHCKQIFNVQLKHDLLKYKTEPNCDASFCLQK